MEHFSLHRGIATHIPLNLKFTLSDNLFTLVVESSKLWYASLLLKLCKPTFYTKTPSVIQCITLVFALQYSKFVTLK